MPSPRHPRASAAAVPAASSVARRVVLPAALTALTALAALAMAPPRAAHAQGTAARRAGAAAPAPRVLTIVAMDYAFQAPATVPAGVTTIRLVNRGTQLHHVQLNRLEDGKTVRDMLREWRPGVANPVYMTGDGGPTAAVGGQTLEGTVVLAPGRYALICWVPAPDGQLHLHKGMFGQLEVTADGAAAVRPVAASPASASPTSASPASAAALPPADVTITMRDYGYLLPDVRAGRRVFRVFNAGPQAHELVMVRLKRGRTVKDAAEWAERGQTGEAPGTMVGGVAALTPGRVSQFAVDVVPGEYALVCFVPDQRDGAGKPHTHYGMMRQFTVR